MKEVLALNKISPLAQDALGKEYKVVDESKSPVGILVRSFKMHDYQISDSVLCVARAGAGVNNIPTDEYANKGIVVFNTPGANANAVKELVLAGMFMCGRRLVPAISWAQGLTEDVAGQVEKGKSQFVGHEIMGKTLAVYGLGAIGKLVAIDAAKLGMNVVGFDPFVSKEAVAFLASHNVTVMDNLDAMVAQCDFFSLHVPYNDQTKEFINKKRLATMKDGVNIINCARGELVNNDDIKEAIASGKVNRYVTDFPTEAVLGNENIITFPHLGASSPEAEDNCAVMAGQQMADFIENGNIKNGYNFPAVSLERTGKCRVVLLCSNECDVNQLPKQMTKLGTVTGSACTQGQGACKTSSAIFDFAEKLDDKTVQALEGRDCIIKARIV